MPKERLNFIAKRLGNKKSVEVTRADMLRIINSKYIELDEPLRLYIFGAILEEEDKLKQDLGINFDLIKTKLLKDAIEENELIYLIDLLTSGGKKDE